MPNKNVIEVLMSDTGCKLHQKKHWQYEQAPRQLDANRPQDCKVAAPIYTHTNIRSCVHTHTCAHTYMCTHMHADTHTDIALSSTPMITSSNQNVDSHMFWWGCLEGSGTCPCGLSTEMHLLLRPQGTRQASPWPRVTLRVKSRSTRATQTRDSTASLLWSTAQDNKQRGSHRGPRGTALGNYQRPEHTRQALRVPTRLQALGWTRTE